MPSLLDTSLSGLRAYQGALSTTSQNIANVGNEDYTRQRVEFNARLPIKQGSGFVGQGVDLTSVNRVIDSFNTINVRELTANTARLEAFESFSSRIENVIADQDASLLPTLNSFFGSLNDVANDPSANAPRVALIATAESLQQRFLSISGELKNVEDEINSRIRSDINEINAITSDLASLNNAITRISAPDKRPSDLLDKRDGLVKKLAEKISVTVVEQRDGSFNVLVGTGQLLVTNSTSLTLVAQTDDAQPDKVSVAVQSGSGGTVGITNALVGGDLGGIIDFRDNLLNATQNRLGRTAIGVSEAMNAQNIQGLDLKGDLGENLFSTVSTGVLQGQFGGDYIANGFDRTGETVTFNLGFDGVNLATSVAINAGETNDVIAQNILTAIGVAAGVGVVGGVVTVPGTTTGQSMRFSLYGSNIQFEKIGGPSTLGNDLQITGLADDGAGAGNANDAIMSLSALGSSSTRTTAGAVSNGNNASFLGPSTVAIPNANNTGTGIANFSITDIAQLTNSDYELSFNGGNYTLIRLSDSATVVNGVGPNFSVDGLEISTSGVPVNGDSFFIRPTQNGALSFKSLVSDPAKIAAAFPVRATSNVANIGDISVNKTTVTDALNGDLTDTVDIVFNPAGTFNVVDRATGVAFPGQTNISYFDGINVTQNGWQIQIKGSPQVGDTLTVQQNTNSASDNRNMLLLAGLQTKSVLDNNTTTFEQTYNALTSEVGVVSQQVSINLDVEKSLLQSAFARRESVSGVNLDEEAADLIRFQQAYQALARIIQASDEIFQSLLASV
ncbi:Flagellar hook-associated protein FlgK [hydrothermal vent metagenome]|uniref:Flagellar hook-associated protein FlgK n=1 Tax=hydrothermal vent metagenome TaxID=652676 RepID=A0A3B0WEJ3_9ZZZZ